MVWLLKVLWRLARGLMTLLFDTADLLRNLSLSLSLAASLFILIHLGADHIDDLSFVALNYWDLRWDQLSARLLMALSRLGLLSNSLANNWSLLAADALGIEGKEKLSALMALCLEISVDLGVLWLWQRLKKRRLANRNNSPGGSSTHLPNTLPVAPKVVTAKRITLRRFASLLSLAAASVCLFALFNMSPLASLGHMIWTTAQGHSYQGPSPLAAYRLPLQDRNAFGPWLASADFSQLPRSQRLQRAIWPVALQTRVSSPFGPRRHPVLGRRSFHHGVDLAVPVDSAVHSMWSGRVTRVAEDAVSGLYLRVDHGQGIETVYCHLHDVSVRQGEPVQRGQRIASSGNSGRSTGPHLHLGLRLDGKLVDPLPLRRQGPRSVTFIAGR